MADGQAQAVAPVLALDVLAGLGEAAKQIRLVWGGDANAGVVHGKHQTVGVDHHMQPHMAFGGELERIAQQIDQDLHQAVAVPADPGGHAGGDLQLVGNRHALHFGRKQIKRMADGRVQVEDLLLGVEPPGQKL